MRLTPHSFLINYNHLSKNNGFTLIETIVILLLIGILISVATPRFLSIRDEAINASTVSIISNVNSGIILYYVTGDAMQYPERLDQAEVGESSLIKPYFEVVLMQGISNKAWSKTISINHYHAPNDSIYVYDPVNGRLRYKQ